LEIEGMSRSLILDTGSKVSILQPGVLRGDVKVTTMKPYGVTGKVLYIKYSLRIKQDAALNPIDGRRGA